MKKNKNYIIFNYIEQDEVGKQEYLCRFKLGTLYIILKIWSVKKILDVIDYRLNFFHSIN